MYSEFDGLKVFYKSHGEGRPLLVLHGIPADHRFMAGFLEPIVEGRTGWRRIYPDLPGFGRTQAPDWLSGSDGLLDALAGFVDALLPEERFSLLGMSYGGYLAQGLLQRMPDRVEGIALIVPVIYADHGARETPPHVVLHREAGLAESLPDEARELLEGYAVVQGAEFGDRILSEVIPSSADIDQDFMQRLEANYPLSREPIHGEVVYPGPALIVCRRQDWVTGYRDALRLLDRFPRATHAILDRAGHIVAMEQQALVYALVQEWLDRVEAET